ncbi:hypothetical protein F4780DRAFT_69739 [Xylariomycetidae sp. FL0641]|nr:hypothetical protein F4780DRAFT_69739 [Xylariomycetidae sp. FL0641]
MEPSKKRKSLSDSENEAEDTKRSAAELISISQASKDTIRLWSHLDADAMAEVITEVKLKRQYHADIVRETLQAASLACFPQPHQITQFASLPEDSPIQQVKDAMKLIVRSFRVPLLNSVHILAAARQSGKLGSQKITWVPTPEPERQNGHWQVLEPAFLGLPIDKGKCETLDASLLAVFRVEYLEKTLNGPALSWIDSNLGQGDSARRDGGVVILASLLLPLLHHRLLCMVLHRMLDQLTWHSAPVYTDEQLRSCLYHISFVEAYRSRCETNLKIKEYLDEHMKERPIYRFAVRGSSQLSRELTKVCSVIGLDELLPTVQGNRQEYP